MRILTLANQKGGTGKSTTAAALAQATAAKGKKCLAVDLDPQCNLTLCLAANTSSPGTLELLEGQPATVQHTASGVDVIAASWNLQTIKTSKGSARRLQAALAPMAAQYDLIIIDTPPTAGELQYNALMASTDLIIPLQADIFGLQGLYMVSDTAHQMQQSNPALKITGCILTRHSGRSTLGRQMAEAIEQRAQQMKIPFLGVIREAVAVREAQALQRSLFDYAPTSKPAQDYMRLYEQLNL